MPNVRGPLTVFGQTLPPADPSAKIGYQLGNRPQFPQVAANTGAATVNIDVTNGEYQTVALTQSFTTLTFSNVNAGTRIRLLITGTPPVYITWPSNVVFSGGNAPSLGAATEIEFVSYDGNTLYAEGGDVPGINPASIPTLHTLNEARRNIDIYADGASLNGATIPSAVGTSLVSTATATTFQKLWAPVDYVRSNNVYGDRLARYNLTPVGSGLSYNPGISLGGNGNPFTVFYVFEYVDSFPQCYIADRTSPDTLLRIDHSSFNQVAHFPSTSTFTQNGSPAPPLGYRPNAAGFRTGQVMVLQFSGNNADAEPVVMRINGIACTRAGTKPSVNALNGFFFGGSPLGSRDCLHWAAGVAVFTSALDFSSPWSPGRMMERYFGTFLGYSL